MDIDDLRQRIHLVGSGVVVRGDVKERGKALLCEAEDKFMEISR
jgi:hypothetical protein